VAHGELAGALSDDPGWQLIYFDDLAAVLVERASNPELAERLGYRELRLGVDFARQPPDRLTRMLREAERAEHAAPQAGMPLAFAAMIRAAQGDHAGYERDLAAATERAPHLPDPWFRLGRQHLAAGQFARAQTELARAVALREDNPRYRQLYALACLRAGDRGAAERAVRPLAPSQAERDRMLSALQNLPQEALPQAR
jgi:hypothetical protein